MGFQISAGVEVKEFDLTTIVPAVATTQGALAGVFGWGPIEERQLVSNQDELALRYGRPTSNNFETWYTGSDFLDYGNALYISRANANSYQAIAGPTYNVATTSNTLVKNQGDYQLQEFTVSNSGTSYYIAKWAGALGNSLRISVCDNANSYNQTLTGNATVNATFSFAVGSNVMTMAVEATSNTIANTMTNSILGAISVGDLIQAGNTTIGTQALKVSAIGTPSASGNTVTTVISLSNIMTLSSNVSQTELNRYWEFATVVPNAPGRSAFTEKKGGGNDELHVVIVDDKGAFTGVAGEVLEVFPNLSRATDATGEQGGSLYYKNVLNNSSKYVWYASDRSGAISNTAVNVANSSATTSLSLKFYGGSDGYTETTVPIMNLARAYDLFKSAEDIDISLVMTGKSRGGVNGEQLANYLIDNIAEVRKDCVVFISPDQADVVNNAFSPEDAVVAFKNSIRSTSYAVVDSGYKYTYDKYNDVYRWVPLNGDIAGLCVNTDNIRDPWWSPAGFNRGFIKNVVKLAFNPSKARRDVLYAAGVNPVVTFPGEGTILYGDKTAQKKPSAFDRINVRRLFIVLEKAIATAAKYTLFEFNDEFTRAQFRNMVEPYLRDIMGRRGIYAYRVVCDETNNTPEVIDSNRFIGTIMIKPARSINFITLNFVAVRTGVDFEEVAGGGF